LNELTILTTTCRQLQWLWSIDDFIEEYPRLRSLAGSEVRM